MINTLYNRRWYDQITNMTLAIGLSQLLPPEIQSVIAKNLNDAIDSYRSEAKRNPKQPITVSPLHVSGLYKASVRQRWYDPHKGLFRAFNFMGTLPESYLVSFAGNIIILAREVHNKQGGLIYLPGKNNEEPPQEVKILQGQGVMFEESEGGFRLASNGLGTETQYIRPSSSDLK